jgi:predicted aldo/keto reductase-like oxidoreductase
MQHAKRRQFLKTSFAVASGALLGGFPGRASGTPATGTAKPISRTLGRTGLRLPVVSMGVMRSDSPGLVRAALEQGLTHLDTAHGYQKGRNEEMLGKVLADYPRDSFVIATKVPPESGDSSAAVLAWLAKVDLSLKRLQMDVLDILYVHAIGSRSQALAPAMLDALQQAKESGRAKFVGLSTHANEPEVLDAAVESGVYDVVLTSVNFKQDHYPSVKAAIGRAAAAGIGIVGMKTMAGAFYDKAKTRPINCRAALKFVLQDPHVTTTIPGITTFDQLAENSRVNSDITLTEEEQDALAAGSLEGGLYCQQCDHCVSGCKNGIPIPAFMRAFMYTYGYRDLGLAHALLKEVNARENPCLDCTTCTAECVKGFPVRERIEDVRRVGMIPEELLT